MKKIFNVKPSFTDKVLQDYVWRDKSVSHTIKQGKQMLATHSAISLLKLR